MKNIENKLIKPQFDIDEIRTKFSYFFYLNNISAKFDLDLEDYHFDDDEGLDRDDQEDLQEFTDLTKSTKVISIVNSVFDRITHLTSNKEGSLFVDFNEDKDQSKPNYLVFNKDNDFSRSNIGNIHTNKMYAFLAKVNKKSYLYSFYH